MTASQPRESAARLEENIRGVILGKDEAVRLAVVSLLARGHVLIEDVPGVGKTVLAKAIARSVRAEFKRVQFTPDLLPSDVTGVTIYNQKTGGFEFRPGPVFTDILLADEINRGTPRTQSALLEAMEERQVTVDGTTHPLHPGFFVLASQNPVEQHGTFPLPEAQLDRFLTRIQLGYTRPEQEVKILQRQAERHPLESLEPVLALEDLAGLQRAVRAMFIHPSVQAYIVALVHATRAHEDVLLGASPRGSLALMRTAQAMALVEGRPFVVPEMVKSLAHPVLDHRIILTPQARLSGTSAASVVDAILDKVEVPTLDEVAAGAPA